MANSPLILRGHVRHHRPDNRKRNDGTTTEQPGKTRQPDGAQRKDIRVPHDNELNETVEQESRDAETDSRFTAAPIRQ